uniref:Uncharacterized protein n=1 Tax=Clastoptera arizonana TaxID=38151 RepID=A0A1B6D0Z1_9HEMI
MHSPLDVIGFSLSFVHLRYHWEIQKANIPGTLDLPENGVKILQPSGNLLAQSFETVSICFTTPNSSPSQYRTILVLFIDELPRKCIEIEDREHLKEFNESDGQSIKVAMIEVWLECIKPNVIINPFMIDLPTELLQCGIIEEIKVEFINNSPGGVSIELKQSPCNHIKTYCMPNSFNLDKFASNQCALFIEPINIGYFTCIIKCIVNGGDEIVDLSLSGKCSSGSSIISPPSLDFGITKQFTKPVNEINIQNSFSNELTWKLEEIEYKKDEKLTTLSANQGHFCHSGCCVYGNYEFDLTYDVGIKCLLLEWSQGNNLMYTSVLADVLPTDVSLEMISYTFDKLYLNVEAPFKVTVCNHGAIPTKIFWGHPLGNQHHLLVLCEPNKSTLMAGEHKQFQISVLPIFEGKLEDFYVPCFVEQQNFPLLLQIEGKVENIRVLFKWQNTGTEIEVPWPSPESQLPIACSLSFCDSSSTSSTNTVRVQEVEESSLHTDTSEPYVNWPIVGGKYTPCMADSVLESDNKQMIMERINNITSDTNKNDFSNYRVLSFLDIPSKQAISQNILIVNDTGIKTNFNCKLNEFVSNYSSVKTDDVLTTLQKKVFGLPITDELFLYTDKRKGLLITVKPDSGILPAHDQFTLEIAVYVLAWGYYVDVITIQIGLLPPFDVYIDVLCNTPPVSLSKDKISFGSLHYLEYENKNEILHVLNNSCVTVLISWQLFVEFPSLNNMPFSLSLIDNYDGDIPFSLSLMPGVGNFCSEIFQINNFFTRLEPWSKEAVEIIFNPKKNYVNATFENLHIPFKGHILGHVYSDETYCCYRQMGIDLKPLKASIEASVIVPKISILNLENLKLIFECDASNIIENNKLQIMAKTVVVSNRTDVQLETNVSITEPFYITSAFYSATQRKVAIPFTKVSLNPKETCEVSTKQICVIF